MNAPSKTELEAPYVLREDEDGVATLTLNRGDRMNPLSTAMLSALQTELDAEVDKLVRKIVTHSGAVASLGKRLFYDQVEKGLVDAYSLASEGMACNMMLEDAGEGIDAFIEKRKPGWRGR